MGLNLRWIVLNERVHCSGRCSVIKWYWTSLRVPEDNPSWDRPGTSIRLFISIRGQIVPVSTDGARPSYRLINLSSHTSYSECADAMSAKWNFPSYNCSLSWCISIYNLSFQKERMSRLIFYGFRRITANENDNHRTGQTALLLRKKIP